MINQGNLNLVGFLPFRMLYIFLIRMKLGFSKQVRGADTFKNNMFSKTNKVLKIHWIKLQICISCGSI